MAREQDSEQEQELLRSVPLPRDAGESESLTTVVVAFVANVLIAIAKTAAAVLTGSASLTAEAAHSWADSGNEIFLLIADRGRVDAAGSHRPRARHF
jgi:Co/Zn/Cd efflux system component